MLEEVELFIKIDGNYTKLNLEDKMIKYLYDKCLRDKVEINNKNMKIKGAIKWVEGHINEEGEIHDYADDLIDILKGEY